MYSADHNCLFVHIPKTAGKSIERYFLGLLGLRWEQRAALLLRPNSDLGRGPERLAHLTASEYVDLGYMTRNQFDSSYRFSFVRNPWSRLVSEYRYRKHYLHFSFRDYIDCQLPEPGMSDAYRHVMPQSEFIYSPAGELLVDFVGRFENLQADFAVVCQSLELATGVMPHVKDAAGVSLGFVDRLRDLAGMSLEAGHGHYTDYYDDHTRNRVAEMYARDIELFGYEFDSAK